jgi:hypothetical protein
MRRKIAVIDFDGTIIKHAFPEIGEPMEDAFEVMKALKEAGWVLVLYTCREDCSRRKYLTEAVEFCLANGVEFDGVNETPLDHEFRDEKGLRRKPYGDVYIDDRNIGGFVGWRAVKAVLLDECRLYWGTYKPR